MLGFMEDIQSVRVEIAEDGRRIAGIYLNGKKVEEKYLDLDGIKFGFRLNENMFIEVECECISKSAARTNKRDEMLER